MTLSEAAGGEAADRDLAHAIRYLEEMEVALDAFEEDLEQLGHLRDLIARAPERGRGGQRIVILPADFPDWDAYLKRRQTAHGRLFVLALWQVGDALRRMCDDGDLVAVRQAVVAIEHSFPGLNALRNAIAHAAERARRPAPSRDGPLTLSSILARHGHCDGVEFVMDPGKADEPEVRIAVSGESLARVVSILQALADQLPWAHRLEERRPLRAWLG